MKKGGRNILKMPGQGKECPRCGEKTEWRAHSKITQKELARPFYYERWYKCTNRGCKTTIFMDDEDRVYTGRVSRKAQLWQEHQERLSFFRSL